MRALIAGCGYVGSALGELLAAEGHTVFGLRRNPAALPNSITPVAADLSRPLDPESLPQDLDLVFYTASSGGSDDAAYRSAYVDGPRHLLESLEPQSTNIRRVLFTSSTGVYAQKNGEWVDETSPTESEGHTGRRLLGGERVILGGPFPATVVRLSGIYGPGRARSIQRVLDAALDEGPPAYTNRIHRDDCAGALRHIAFLPEPKPVYLATDHEPTDRRTITEWLSKTLGRKLPESSNPGPQRRRTNKRCSNERLLASGYEFLYPTFREGFAELLDEV